MHNLPTYRVRFLQHIDEVLKGAEEEASRRKEERRALRRRGGLPERAYESLRTCTIPQLLKAKKLCDEFIRDQREAPPDENCDKPFTIAILLSVPLRNVRYRYEIVRSTKRAEKIYINGPYWYRYWRDGKMIYRQAVGKKNEKQLPPKVKAALREYKAAYDVARVLEEVREKYRC
jgi:hypothetical protein